MLRKIAPPSQAKEILFFKCLDSFSFSGNRTVAERIMQGNKLSLEQKQFLACNLGLFSSEADEIV